MSTNRALLLSFAAAILVGAALLSTDAASAAGEGLPFIDALFTATSAVCVTGLVVVDTGAAFSRFGQSVILALIQLGGLGIMTYSTFVLLLAGKRISLRDRAIVQSAFSPTPIKSARRLLAGIVATTLAAEAVGAALLYAEFGGVPDRLYSAVFHAVSAFCNAGFSLYADSLARFRASPAVNLTVTALIVLGGIGFPVVRDVAARLTGRAKRLSLHAKLALSSYGAMLAVGVVYVYVMEWGNALRGLGYGEQALAVWTQTVTLRTAGFNTLDFANLSNATLFFAIIYMFVGACPGSTGGGVKTTTAALLLAAVRSRFRGENGTTLFQRTVPEATVTRALAVVLASFALLNAATLLLVILETGGVSHGDTRGRFLELLFEATSAFGTVGLSMGVTSGLTFASKLVIVGLMFTGRLGPLTLALAVEPREAKRFAYAEENVMVG